MGKNKYKQGEKILTLSELVAELDTTGVVNWRTYVRNKAFLENWSLKVIRDSLEAGVFRKAVKNDNH